MQGLLASLERLRCENLVSLEAGPKLTGQNHFHQTGFLTYEHLAEPIYFVVIKAALHHLPDFWKQVGLLRIEAMLKPGGILYLRDAVFSFAPSDYQSAINTWIDRVA